MFVLAISPASLAGPLVSDNLSLNVKLPFLVFNKYSMYRGFANEMINYASVNLPVSYVHLTIRASELKGCKTRSSIYKKFSTDTRVSEQHKARVYV